MKTNVAVTYPYPANRDAWFAHLILCLPDEINSIILLYNNVNHYRVLPFTFATICGDPRIKSLKIQLPRLFDARELNLPDNAGMVGFLERLHVNRVGYLTVVPTVIRLIEINFVNMKYLNLSGTAACL